MGIPILAPGIPIPAEAYPDTVVVYPKVKTQGVRGGPVESDGTPVSLAASVQVTSLSSQSVHEAAVASQRFGKLISAILLRADPATAAAIVNGTRMVQTRNLDGALASPVEYRSVGEPIPRDGSGNRWTVLVARNA